MNPASILSNSSYPALKRYVLDHTGLAYYTDKDEDLATRISRRVIARDAKDAAAYLNVLVRDPAEMDCLVGELTIGETYFFRQKEHFELLKSTIIPYLLERKRPSRSIRIWSAGCATGAEPYSISLLLALEFETALAGWDIPILATDINVDFLAQAREARFGEWAMRETSPAVKARCFRPDGKQWVLRPEYRQQVAFRYHNLAANAHPAADKLPFDLILCRNVLIYFSQDTMRDVAARLYSYLDPGGWLLVGHAEPNSTTFGMFDAVMTPAGTAYRRNAARGRSGSHWTDLSSTPWTPPAVFPVELPPPASLPASAAAPEALPPQATNPLPVDAIRLLADSGRWNDALDAADQLVQAHPLDAPAQFTLGLILEHSGSHDAARTALRRAIYIDRSFALAHYHLATSLKAAGDAASARRSFSNALRLLRVISPADPLPHGDGITAGELSDLATMHLDLIAA